MGYLFPWRNQLSAVFALVVSVATFSAAEAQTTQRVDVAGDGSAFTVALNSSELGKEYALLTEIKTLSAVTASVSLSGPTGVVGKIFVKAVPANQNIETLDLNPLYWKPVPVRYINGDFRAQIITGEDPYLGEGQGIKCPSYLGAAEINLMLTQLRAVYGPGFTKQQLCLLLTSQLAGFNVTSLDDYLAPDGATPLARGVVMRDACSKAYKYIVQFRINPTGLPWYEYTGLQNITATLNVAPAKPISAGFKFGEWRLKESEGRDNGAWIFLTAALGLAMDEKYGAPGTDTLYLQYWKNGEVQKKKEYKGKTRILYGSKLLMINKDPTRKHLNGKKKTFTFVNGDSAYSFCASLKAEDSCNKAYAKATGIKCKKVYSK